MSHKVLFATASQELVRQVTEALEQAGYQVLSALDGTQALARAAAEQPDLACLDLDMPGASGLEVCERLKAERPLTVLITAEFLDDRTSAGFAKAGADDLVFKPFTMDEIVDKVAWYLSPED